MSHVSLPRLGHLAENNNYDSPSPSPPSSSDTSGPDDDDESTTELAETPTTTNASTPLPSQTIAMAAVISDPKTSEKSLVVPIESTTGSTPLESVARKNSNVVIVPVKRKHQAGKPYFQEVSDK